MSHATTTDVGIVLLRELTDEETDLATRLLSLAASTLRGKIPNLEFRMSDDVDFDDVVNYVEASAVARILRNPEGYSYEVIGPYAVQRPGSGILDTFEFTAGDLAKLGVGSGAFTIAPYMAPPTLPPSDFPVELLPWWGS